MASKRLLKAREWVEWNAITSFGEAEVELLRAALAPISDRALRDVVRELGLPMHPLVEGVRQQTMEELGRTLTALLHQYEPGDPATKHRIRQMVITAKDHARLAARRKPEKQAMVDVMLVWLENPPVFESWWRLRQGRPNPA